MEFFYGVVLLMLGMASIAWVIRDGRKAADWLVRAGVTIQILVIALIFADWGHSWVETSGVSIVLDRFVWLALPHMLAVLSLVGLLVYGRDFRGWAGLLGALQAGLLIVVLLAAEQKIDLSFLAPVPLVSMFASSLAAFIFVASSLAILPGRDSFWYRFVFKPRENLVAEVKALEAFGFEIEPPTTVFECGSAKGWMEGSRIEVRTVPKTVPPRYGLQIRVSISRTWHGQRLPKFAGIEKWELGSGWIEYQGFTDAAFDMAPGSLVRFIKDLAGVS